MFQIHFLNLNKIIFCVLLVFSWYASVLNSVEMTAAKRGSQKFLGKGKNVTESITLGNLDSLYVEWTTSNTTLASCVVITPSMSEIQLIPGLTDKRIKYLGEGFESGHCGFQIHNLENSDQGIWSLQARTINNIVNKKSYNVTILEYHHDVNRTIVITAGDVVRFSCGPSEAIYCELISPKNENPLINYGPCSTTLYDAQKEKYEGLWKCKYAVPGYAQYGSAMTQIYIRELKIEDIGYNETNEEVNIFCNSFDVKIVSSFCHLKTPTGKDLYISPGRGTPRYRFYGKEKYHCGVTIPKPLTEEEYGMWFCDLRTSSKHYGGYLLVKNKSMTPSLTSIIDGKEFLKATPSYIYAQTYSSITLTCRAFVSLEYCWFRDPKGNLFPWDKMNSNGGLQFGFCTHTISSSNSSHSGEWTCTAGLAYESVQESTAKIKVEISDVPFVAQPHSINGAVGYSATLLCKHPEKLALKYCRFIRPDGVGLNVGNSKHNGNYNYAGEGLEMGECGLVIESVQDVDFGMWTCATLRLQVTDTENPDSLIATVMLKPPEGMSLASSVGISLGSLIAIGIIAFIITVKCIRPRCKKEVSDETIALTETSSPDQDDRYRPAFNISGLSFGTHARKRSPKRTGISGIY